MTAALVEDGDLPISKTDIQVLINKITNEMPLESDVDRVRSHLAAGGWTPPAPHRPDLPGRPVLRETIEG